MDIFYYFPKSRKLKKELLEKCILLANPNIIWVEELDCKISLRRRPTNKSREEILKFALENEKTLYFFIRRKFDPEFYFEVGLSVPLGDKEYFIFMNLNKESGNFLMSKYKLKSHEKTDF